MKTVKFNYCFFFVFFLKLKKNRKNDHDNDDDRLIDAAADDTVHKLWCQSSQSLDVKLSSIQVHIIIQ